MLLSSATSMSSIPGVGTPPGTLMLDQHARLAAHCLKGIGHLERLGEFMRQRSVLEAEYAQKLKCLVDYFKTVHPNKKEAAVDPEEEENKFSVLRAFNELLSNTSVISDQHGHAAATLERDGTKVVQEAVNALSNERRKVVQDVQLHQTNVSGRRAMVEQSLRVYHKAVAEAAKAQDKAQKALGDFKRPRADVLRKQEVHAAKARESMEAQHACHAQIQEAQRTQRLYEDQMLPQILVDLRALELRRTDAFKSVMQMFVHLNQTMDSAISICMDKIGDAAENIQEDEESSKAMAEYNLALKMVRDKSETEARTPAGTIRRSQSVVGMNNSFGNEETWRFKSSDTLELKNKTGGSATPKLHQRTSMHEITATLPADLPSHLAAMRAVDTLGRNTGKSILKGQPQPSTMDTAQQAARVTLMITKPFGWPRQRTLSQSNNHHQNTASAPPVEDGCNWQRIGNKGPRDNVNNSANTPSSRRKSLVLSLTAEELLQKIQEEEAARTRWEQLKNGGTTSTSPDRDVAANTDHCIAESTARLTDLWSKFAQHAQDQSEQGQRGESGNHQQTFHQVITTPNTAESSGLTASAPQHLPAQRPLPPTPKTPKIGVRFADQHQQGGNINQADISDNSMVYVPPATVSVKDRIKWLNGRLRYPPLVPGVRTQDEGAPSTTGVNQRNSIAMTSAGANQQRHQQPEDADSGVSTVWSESIYATPDQGELHHYYNTAEAGGGEMPVSFRKALFDFKGNERGDLSVTAGEDLEILQEDGKGWSCVRRKEQPSQIGFIPTSYVGSLMTPVTAV